MNCVFKIFGSRIIIFGKEVFFDRGKLCKIIDFCFGIKVCVF